MRVCVHGCVMFKLKYINKQKNEGRKREIFIDNDKRKTPFV
jgi:hypothetical protein